MALPSVTTAIERSEKNIWRLCALYRNLAVDNEERHAVHPKPLCLLASFLDGIVTAILTYALLIPLMLLFGLSLSSLAQNELAGAGASVSFMLLYYGISLGLPALYFAWMHSCPTQASLGKMAVGARVVRGNGDPVGFGRALLRYLNEG